MAYGFHPCAFHLYTNPINYNTCKFIIYLTENHSTGDIAMSLQKQFEEFNKVIKLDYDEKKELRDKRDILLNKLRASSNLPSFSEFNQGSYKMNLGVEPLNKEYDIDVGLRFNINIDEYAPMDIKKEIKEILKNHTEYGAQIKKPCVTVTYKKDGEAAYHIDLVVYAYENKDDSNSQLYLAKGKTETSTETKWEKSDPIGLIDYVSKKYDGDNEKNDKEQFKRIIRYLKRWKNNKFNSTGNAEPPSIGITLIAVDKFISNKRTDPFTNTTTFNDLDALISFVKELLSLFSFVGYSDSGEKQYTITYYLPISLNFEPLTNVFKKMSVIQMTDFRNKVEILKSDLETVRNEVDEYEQCKKLQQIFGSGFPIPNIDEFSKQQINYIPRTSSSGA